MAPWTPRWPRSTRRRPRSTPPSWSAAARSTRSSGWSAPRSILFGLVGWALFHWRRFGKDPVYLDDPSILMPAPPPDLTAASGAMVMDGGTSRRALTTAMLDLASRGLISFREDGGGILGTSTKVGVDVDPPRGDQVEEARRALNTRRPIGPAEEVALHKLRDLGGTADRRLHLGPRTCPSSARPSPSSTRRSRSTWSRGLVRRGAEQGRSSRWIGRGMLAIIGGVVALILGFNVPISGLTPDRRRGGPGGHRRPDHRPGDAGGDDAPAR